MTSIHSSGPYALCSPDRDVLAGCPHVGEAGVYLWAVATSEHGLVVDYVGETSTSFYKRTKEHVIQTLGGNYLVLDPDAMLRGQREVVWNGLWRPGTRDQLPAFLTRLEELGSVSRRYLMLHHVLVAPFAGDRRLRHRIEAAIASTVYESQPRLVADDIRCRRRRADEEPIGVTITADCAVRGLRSWVEV